MRVIFAIPMVTGQMEMRCHQSLVELYRFLSENGIEYDERTICNCPDIVTARNSLVALFLEDERNTDLFFIDSDVGFDAAGALAILQRPEEFVCGVYPLKRDAGGFPVKLETAEDGTPRGKWIGPAPDDYLLRGKLAPGGFMRIKREVFKKLDEAFPELSYDDDYVLIEGTNLKGGKNYFCMGIYENTFRTEDFAFSSRWKSIGGDIWIYPKINFTHVGRKDYTGNYHEYLLNLPGGKNTAIHNAVQIEGWMSVPELMWLASQAATHKYIVEIGSWKGRSTRALADNTDGLVYAIDTWQGSEEHKKTLGMMPEGELFRQFQKNTADLKNLTPICKASVDAARDTMLHFDMVFIDGSHDYENVKADIQTWKPKLTSDGLLCGHDYSWPGVRQAVEELLPGAQVVPGTDIWFWRN